MNFFTRTREAEAISRHLRDVSPAHFTFKVESFSLLSKTSLKSLVSDTFEAGGYKWRLSLYPMGNTKANAKPHISLYLMIDDTNNLPIGWEVFVSFKLFVFDHINNKFLTIQDAGEELRRFSNIKTQWGFDQLLPISTFNDASNRYLYVDSCIFGAEVFVHKSTCRAECVSMVEHVGESYTWTVNNFSTLLESDKEYICSDFFTIGGHKWRLALYPKGLKQEEKFVSGGHKWRLALYPKGLKQEEKFVSLYLEKVDWLSESPAQRLYVEYKLRIRDQTAKAHVEMEYHNWFCASSRIKGSSKFLSVSRLSDPLQSYKWNDIVIVEVEFKTLDTDKKIVEKMNSCRIEVPTTKDTIPTIDDASISRSLRDGPPAHFTFKVESFSLFSKTHLEKLESDIFEAGGYNWRLALYPGGNKKRTGKDHISLYLIIADVPCGCDIFASFKFFVFDHSNAKFLTIQDGKIRRFSYMKTEWGFDQLLPLGTFNDVSIGYLDDDSCIFGAEVFVHKYSGRTDCLSMLEPRENTYTWTINNFSTLLDKKLHYSNVVDAGGRKWKLLLYPKGNGNNEYLSVYLEIADLVSRTPAQRVLAEFKLRIRSQTGFHATRETTQHWFTALSKSWGYSQFLLLSSFNDPAKSFKLKDVVIVQAEIKVLAVLKSFS